MTRKWISASFGEIFFCLLSKVRFHDPQSKSEVSSIFPFFLWLLISSIPTIHRWHERLIGRRVELRGVRLLNQPSEHNSCVHGKVRGSDRWPSHHTARWRHRGDRLHGLRPAGGLHPQHNADGPLSVGMRAKGAVPAKAHLAGVHCEHHAVTAGGWIVGGVAARGATIAVTSATTAGTDCRDGPFEDFFGRGHAVARKGQVHSDHRWPAATWNPHSDAIQQYDCAQIEEKVSGPNSWSLWGDTEKSANFFSPKDPANNFFVVLNNFRKKGWSAKWPTLRVFPWIELLAPDPLKMMHNHFFVVWNNFWKKKNLNKKNLFCQRGTRGKKFFCSKFFFL